MKQTRGKVRVAEVVYVVAHAGPVHVFGEDAPDTVLAFRDLVLVPVSPQVVVLLCEHRGLLSYLVRQNAVSPRKNQDMRLYARTVEGVYPNMSCWAG